MVFRGNCGATTAYSIHVSVLPLGQKLKNEAGNAFIADTGHADLPLQVTTTWESDRTLRLTYDTRLRIFLKERAVRDVKLLYPSAP